LALLLLKWPEAFTDRYLRLDPFNSLIRQVLPRPARGSSHQHFDNFRHFIRRIIGLTLRFRRKRLFIAINHPLYDMSRCYAWQIRAARRHGERQGEADEIVDWITDNRLIQVTYLNSQAAITGLTP
jgi:hypothetical protein